MKVSRLKALLRDSNVEREVMRSKCQGRRHCFVTPFFE